MFAFGKYLSSIFTDTKACSAKVHSKHRHPDIVESAH